LQLRITKNGPTAPDPRHSRDPAKSSRETFRFSVQYPHKWKGEYQMKKYVIPILLCSCILFAGCATSTSKTSDATEKPADTTIATEATVPLVTEAAPVTETTLPVDLVLPITENTSGEVMIQTVSRGNSSWPFTSYIISSIAGENVVVDPTAMPSNKIVEIHPAAIVSTHPHDDHYSPTYNKKYDCPKIMFSKAEISTNDFRIYTVTSSHLDDSISETENNYIAVFEVDGLRIAAIGGMGQSELTDAQVEELGQLDIVFMPINFNSTPDDMTAPDVLARLHVMEQLNPSIIIPIHYTDEAIPVLEEKYGAITRYDNVMTITKDTLPEGTMNIYMISNTHKYS
jgi:L-ascorbate metabolism protein UlaG (beta-lactamase superfamily)